MTLKSIIDSVYDDMNALKFACRYYDFIDHISLAYHCGSLKDCLTTEETITLEEFLHVCEAYNFYGYDKRICAFRFLLVDMDNCVFLPTWLHIYVFLDKYNYEKGHIHED